MARKGIIHDEKLVRAADRDQINGDSISLVSVDIVSVDVSVDTAYLRIKELGLDFRYRNPTQFVSFVVSTTAKNR